MKFEDEKERVLRRDVIYGLDEDIPNTIKKKLVSADESTDSSSSNSDW